MSVEQRMKGQGNQDNENIRASVKVGQWSNAGSNTSSSNITINKDKFNNHRSDGNNGDYNAWSGSQQVNNQYYTRSNYNKNNGGYESNVRSIERGIQGLNRPSYDRNASANNSNSQSRQDQQQQKDAARKMTWASIASQPPKPTVSTTSSLGIKKKPGMPPPPMVPGRHNMDIGTWDSPSKSGPPLVPPPIVQTAPPQTPKTDFGSSGDTHNTGRSNGSLNNQNPAWPTPGQATSLEAQQAQQQQQPPPQSQQYQQHNQQHRSNERSMDNDRRGYQGSNSSYHNPGAQRENNGRYNNQGPSSYSHHNSNHHSNNMNHNYQHNNARYPRSDDYPNYNGPQSSQNMPQHRPNAPANAIQSESVSNEPPVTLETLLDMSKYNPAQFEIENIHLARFFVIKSYSEDDIHRSIKYNIWCSTEHGNKRLDQAFHEREKEGGAVYLFYSVNGSGHFCGMAQMISNVDYSSNSSVWAQNKWKGSFKVRWIYVKDVPNTQLRAIRLENNENKPVTNSRDTQEVPNDKGEQVWRIIHSYKHSTSLFDDFVHYEQRQREEDSRRVEPGQGQPGPRTPPPPHQYRGGYQDNNNPRDMGPSSGNSYDRNYTRDGESKYNGSGFNGRNNYDRGNSGFDRNYHANGGGYENKPTSGYNRRDDQSSGPDRTESGYSSGNNYSRGNYRNNRGGFNNDYNHRRPEGRERNYRPQYNSVDPENE
uniref:CSON001857 protein n=1 Tax=Culicoides sonorensis TaxID=179676 RepID=A0A336LLS9_CULSO